VSEEPNVLTDWRLRASRPDDAEAMFEVWYTSVLATHDFLAKADFAEICVLVRREYLPHHEFIVAVDDNDRVIGFLHLDGEEIESLFIAPAFRRQGLGRRFMAEAASRAEALEVEVNLQNRQAVGFYQAMGFRAISSTKVDRDGRPYPLLRMRR
jgi:putative acetyltransferase